VVRDNNAATIIEKVATARKTHGSIESMVAPRYPFGQTLMSNFKGAKDKPFKDSIPLIFGSKVGYIRADQITRNHDWVNRWKVLIPKASDGHGRPVSYVLGEPIALAPGSACTQTYLVAGTFETREETVNYANYLVTKFVRFLVLQRKVTQDVTPDRFRFVPFLDMTRGWTDDDLYEHFGLTEVERSYVEGIIQPRSVNYSLDACIPASHIGAGARTGAEGGDDE